MPVYQVSVTINKYEPGKPAREVTITDDAGSSAGPGVLADLINKVAIECMNVVEPPKAKLPLKLEDSALTAEGRLKVERRVSNREDLQSLAYRLQVPSPTERRLEMERAEDAANAERDREAGRMGSLADRLGVPRNDKGVIRTDDDNG